MATAQLLAGTFIAILRAKARRMLGQNGAA